MGKIGMMVRGLREKMGDTQKELGAKIGYSYGGIAKIERGERRPSVDFLEKVAQAYDIDVSYFLGAPQEINDELKEKGVEWVSFVDEMEKRNLTPDELRKVVEFLDSMKKE